MYKHYSAHHKALLGIKSITGLILLNLILLFWGAPQLSHALPEISGISGDPVDGYQLIINGTGFESNSGISKIEWLGGKSGVIESGQTGTKFSRTKWTAYVNPDEPKYSTGKAHSHNKSLLCELTSSYDSGMSYDTSAAISEIYVTWWVYFNFVSSDDSGQWKLWRLSPASSLEDRNTIPGVMASCFYNQSANITQAYICSFCYDNNCNATLNPQCYPDSSIYISGVPNGRWVRLEYYWKANSARGVEDGSFLYYLHGQQGTVTKLKEYNGNYNARDAGTTLNPRYLHWQNYFGNGLEAKAYIDDIFIQNGSQARVELGDKQTWSQCTHREIQTPTAWSNTAITATLNKGSFSPCQTYYLFVVDENGDVNSTGYPVRIVTGAGEAPCPPTGLESSN